MRIFIIFLASLLMGALAQSHAADLPGSAKDAPAGVSVTESRVNPFAGIYGGVTVGGQATDITITVPKGPEAGDYSGINADGFVYGGHLGYNFAFGSRGIFGIEGEFAWSDVNVEAGPLGDVLTMDDYAQISAHIGVRAGLSTLLYVKGGYEWQTWTAGNSTLGEADADVGAWVVGAGIKTLVSPQLAIGLELDYLMFESLDVSGIDDRDNDALSDALEDSDALRVTLKASWYPGAAMADLESLRF